MAVGALVLVGVGRPVDRLSEIRLGLTREFGVDRFLFSGPLIEIGQQDYELPTSSNDLWYDANVAFSYFSKDYPRGDVPALLKLCAYLEGEIPNCEIWYGSDGDERSLRRFTPMVRSELLRQYHDLTRPRNA